MAGGGREGQQKGGRQQRGWLSWLAHLEATVTSQCTVSAACLCPLPPLPPRFRPHTTACSVWGRHPSLRFAQLSLAATLASAALGPYTGDQQCSMLMA
ncbi:hypothetical protein TYRP_018971 [Tyrophagus putrescentiae]|nr:hypothetical protein TYRP_018971 [Tyrophagus putrescentiae]